MLYRSLDAPAAVLLVAGSCLLTLLWTSAGSPLESSVSQHVAAQLRDNEPHRNRRFGGRGGAGFRPRPVPARDEFPQWKNPPGFEQDGFTFVRIQYDSYGPFGWWDRWDNDYPDGDWNFSYRLQQMTSLKVDPDGRVLRFSDPELFRYPFIYLAGVQTMRLSQTERMARRRYLLNGGFMMVDDFWSARAWENLLAEMRQVFPDREPTELSLNHPIFHQVYDLDELPQVVDFKTWSDGFAFEHAHGASDGDHAPHFWAYFDDRGTVVALLCHNNDIGDGWEREAENEAYFREFSEKRSYPLGINVVTYALTH